MGKTGMIIDAELKFLTRTQDLSNINKTKELYLRLGTTDKYYCAAAYLVQQIVLYHPPRVVAQILDPEYDDNYTDERAESFFLTVIYIISEFHIEAKVPKTGVIWALLGLDLFDLFNSRYIYSKREYNSNCSPTSITLHKLLDLIEQNSEQFEAHQYWNSSGDRIYKLDWEQTYFSNLKSSNDNEMLRLKLIEN